MSAVGDFFGVEVVVNPHIPPGVAYLFDRSALSLPFEYERKPSLYIQSAESVGGYIQRRANALRADLGLELVDYRAEALAAAAKRLGSEFRRMHELVTEARLGMLALTSNLFGVTGL